MSRRFLLSMCLVISTPLVVHAQTPEQLTELTEELAQLQSAIEKLDPTERVDIEVCSKGVEWILRHNEFYKENYVDSAATTLKIGRNRIERIQQKDRKWWAAPGKHALGYRSRVDQSVQPYLITVPNSYKAGSNKRWSLYIVLHGRNATLTESHFIGTQDGKPAPDDQDWIQIDVFGRTNNAYRWAGETDVFEAMDDVIKRFPIDETRITLWGFSMGGAGAWHLGLHHPSRWASVGAGAGFVDFYQYQKRNEKLPEYQDQTLHIYDAVDYAMNLSAVPFVTYGGEVDPQLAASLTVQKEAESLDVPLDVIVGPGMGHKFDDVSKAKFMEFLATHNKTGRKFGAGQREIRFVTYTLKYNKCEWLTIHEQAVPYTKTMVESTLDDAGDLQISTENVTALSALRTVANRVSIDGSDPFELNAIGDANLADVYFVKNDDGWQALDYDDSLEFEENPERHKRHDLQGPIDDAFMQPFICVTGSGTPWSTGLQNYADWTLDRFENEFDKWMRGKPVVVKDLDVTEGMIRDHNLILFGDPGSNSILRKVVKELPLDWQETLIRFDTAEVSTADHAVVLVYPNPVNPRRYVVINSGMTMHEQDFKASNAWLFPKLGDYAILQFKQAGKGGFDETVISAGLFDAKWDK